jgi:hypothetical protein
MHEHQLCTRSTGVRTPSRPCPHSGLWTPGRRALGRDLNRISCPLAHPAPKVCSVHPKAPQMPSGGNLAQLVSWDTPTGLSHTAHTLSSLQTPTHPRQEESQLCPFYQMSGEAVPGAQRIEYRKTEYPGIWAHLPTWPARYPSLSSQGQAGPRNCPGREEGPLPFP